MAIPDFQSTMLPLLEQVKDGNPWRMIVVEGKLIEKFKLTDEEAGELKASSTTETLFQNRLRWARLYLKKAGLLEDPVRGLTQITKDGLKVLSQNPDNIDINFLLKFPSFVEFYKKKGKSEKKTTSEARQKSPEDLIIDGFIEIRGNTENEILQKIKKCPPAFFEKIVIQLLEKMGYGDGTVTGNTGDGGIDGMIKQDNLGLDEIYVQAKRWENTVPGKEIRDFAGSLSAKKSKKGVFITTSTFSRDAQEFVKSVDSKIILIDGTRLSELMYKYDICVRAGDSYQLKKIDEDFFSEY
jgi:restriction system protein